MRIGIDMLGLQSAGSRFRGIGRYCAHLVPALLAQGPAHEFFLYAHDGLPNDDFPTAPHATMRLLHKEPWENRHLAINRIAHQNPDHLDLLLVLSPFEMADSYFPPAKPLHGLKLAAVVYDLIPIIFQENYLTEHYWANKQYFHLQALRPYDVLLAISEATRADTLRLLGLPDCRMLSISGATDPGLFIPDRSFPMPYRTRSTLSRLGIKGPFIFSVASMDHRKNLSGLIDALRHLPGRLLLNYQLVVTCSLRPQDAAHIRAYADERGVGDRLVLTNQVDDATLRTLYQRCTAFIFPSYYEGFGLPILEAMQCGAPVVAGNNSSQIEVAGSAALLANVHDPADLADKLARVLSDPDLAEQMRQRGLEQAKQFSWEITASRTMRALEQTMIPRNRPKAITPKHIRVDRPHRRKPRLAIFSPWPPKGSGISDYAVRLVEQLEPHYAIDLYHDAGYMPDLGLSSLKLGCYDYRMFDNMAAAVPYRGVIYQMGNSLYHRFLYDVMLTHPGIVTLHDFSLAGFQHWYSLRPETAPGYLEAEIRHFCPDEADAVMRSLGDWCQEPGGLQEAFTRRGIYLNRRVFETASRVVVHSPWCLDQVRRRFPDHAERTVVIPMGARPRELSEAERAAIRARFDLPADALILASFGILHPNKMNVEALSAYEPLARSHPRCLMLFAGQDWGLGEARRHARELGIEDRVRFLGRPSAEDFADLIAITDIGICLRLPPTNGETSASLLDLLRSGVASIVTDVGTFADYPDHVVRKVKWERDGLDGLRLAIHELAHEPDLRQRLGASARRHVLDQHGWDQAGARYRDLIEQFHCPKSGHAGIGCSRPHFRLTGAPRVNQERRHSVER